MDLKGFERDVFFSFDYLGEGDDLDDWEFEEEEDYICRYFMCKSSNEEVVSGTVDDARYRKTSDV